MPFAARSERNFASETSRENIPSGMRASSAPAGRQIAEMIKDTIANGYASIASGTARRFAGIEIGDCSPKYAIVAGRIAICAASVAASSSGKYRIPRKNARGRIFALGILCFSLPI